MSTNVHSEKIKQIKSHGDVPRHVAIIMDGNGRWATSHHRPRVYGHRRGAESVKAVVEAAGEINIEVLTLFAFSEENWGRPKLEVSAIMKLLERYIGQERDNLNANNVRFRTIGSLERLPASTRRCVMETEEELKNNTGLVLNIALSYGGRSEIAQACRKIAESTLRGELTPEMISPALISENLMTSGLPDPDLIVRTSGEHRISNFLLWQLAYAELYFTAVHWPDFKKSHFFDAIEEYQSRVRRFGLISAESSVDADVFSTSNLEDGAGC